MSGIFKLLLHPLHGWHEDQKGFLFLMIKLPGIHIAFVVKNLCVLLHPIYVWQDWTPDQNWSGFLHEYFACYLLKLFDVKKVEDYIGVLLHLLDYFSSCTSAGPFQVWADLYSNKLVWKCFWCYTTGFSYTDIVHMFESFETCWANMEMLNWKKICELPFANTGYGAKIQF